MTTKRDEAREAIFEKIIEAANDIPHEGYTTISYSEQILQLAQAYREVLGQPRS